MIQFLRRGQTLPTPFELKVLGMFTIRVSDLIVPLRGAFSVSP